MAQRFARATFATAASRDERRHRDAGRRPHDRNRAARTRQLDERARRDCRSGRRGIGLDEIAVEIARLQPADRRGAVRRLRRGITLIDDSYNSSPSALRRALEVVAHEARDTRAVAVLGEMLELGDHSIALHEACGRRPPLPV